MTLNEHFAGFTDYLRENKSERTRYSYTSSVRLYLATLTSDSQFTRNHVAAYISRLTDAARPRCVASHLSAIKAFGNYLVDNEVLSANPAARVKSPALDAPRREVPTGVQVAALADACQRLDSPYRRTLATAIVAVLAYAGLRRGEVLALKLGDIDMAERLIIVRHGKGDKRREVDIDDATLAALRDYLAVRADSRKVFPKNNPAIEDRVFLLRKGFAMGDEGLRILLRQLAEKAGYPKCRALLPHGIRHRYASDLKQAGGDLVEIGSLLGHADEKTTRGYLHNPRERMRELVARAAERRQAIAAPEPPPVPDASAPAPFQGLRLVRYEEA